MRIRIRLSKQDPYPNPNRYLNSLGKLYFIFTFGWNGYRSGSGSGSAGAGCRSGSGKIMPIRPDPNPQHWNMRKNLILFPRTKNRSKDDQTKNQHADRKWNTQGRRDGTAKKRLCLITDVLGQILGKVLETGNQRIASHYPDTLLQIWDWRQRTYINKRMCERLSGCIKGTAAGSNFLTKINSSRQSK